MSAAAAALNAAMMGTETAVDNGEANKAVVHISTDQMYVNDDEANDDDDKKPDAQEKTYQDPNNESATLDRAKEAAKEFVKKHPETQVFKKEPE